MSLSAYPIRNKVWLVRTDEVAEKDVPATLPLGSVILEPGEAIDLYLQLGMAIEKASAASGSVPRVKS